MVLDLDDKQSLFLMDCLNYYLLKKYNDSFVSSFEVDFISDLVSHFEGFVLERSSCGFYFIKRV